MDNLLEQLEQWNKNDEFSRCIEAIEAIPEKERGYKLTVLLGRAYSNLAVLGDHKAHGDDDEVDKELIQHSIDILETVWKQGENDPYWNARMGDAQYLYRVCPAGTGKHPNARVGRFLFPVYQRLLYAGPDAIRF